jgi:hypothetical protein
MAFLRGIRRSHSGLLVSVVSSARSRRFLASSLRMKFPAAGFRAANGGPVELRLKELQAVGLFTYLCFLGAVIDVILN